MQFFTLFWSASRSRATPSLSHFVYESGVAYPSAATAAKNYPFIPALGNPAHTAGFPLSHSHGGGTFSNLKTDS
jgi:hypothetical protein